MLSEIPFRYFFFLGVVVTLVVLSLLRLYRKKSINGQEVRLYAKLPLVTGYTIAYLLMSIGIWTIIFSFGVNSATYKFFYYAGSYIVKFLLLAILYQAFRRFKGELSWWFGLLLLVPIIILYESYFINSMSMYKKINNAMLSFNAVFGMIVYLQLVRKPAFLLGKTWSGLLLGIYLPCLVDWANYTFHIFVTNQNFLVFSYINQTANIVAWLLVLRALSAYEDDSRTPPMERGRVVTAFKRATGAARRVA